MPAVVFLCVTALRIRFVCLLLVWGSSFHPVYPRLGGFLQPVFLCLELDLPIRLSPLRIIQVCPSLPARTLLPAAWQLGAVCITDEEEAVEVVKEGKGNLSRICDEGSFQEEMWCMKPTFVKPGLDAHQRGDVAVLVECSTSVQSLDGKFNQEVDVCFPWVKLFHQFVGRCHGASCGQQVIV